MALSRQPTVLALRALGLGDFLTAVPALRGLRKGFPDHRIVVACPPVLAPLLDLTDIGGVVRPAHGLDPFAWDGPPPELAVNLHGSGPQSHRLLLDVGPDRLVAFASAEAGVAGPAWDVDEHEVARWCRLLREGLGVTADPGDLQLREPEVPVEVPGALVVHPGAAYPSRRWPPERFARVAAWGRDRGLRVVVTGSDAERPLARDVAKAADLSEDSVLAGRTSLSELAGLVASAQLVVCGDTGLAHLASAYRTPSVVLFGPVPPSRWGPPEPGPHEVLWHGDGTGNPFADRPDPGLLAITVEEVLRAAERLTARSGTTRASA